MPCGGKYGLPFNVMALFTSGCGQLGHRVSALPAPCIPCGVLCIIRWGTAPWTFLYTRRPMDSPYCSCNNRYCSCPLWIFSTAVVAHRPAPATGGSRPPTGPGSCPAPTSARLRATSRICRAEARDGRGQPAAAAATRLSWLSWQCRQRRRRQRRSTGSADSGSSHSAVVAAAEAAAAAAAGNSSSQSSRQSRSS